MLSEQEQLYSIVPNITIQLSKTSREQCDHWTKLLTVDPQRTVEETYVPTSSTEAQLVTMCSKVVAQETWGSCWRRFMFRLPRLSLHTPRVGRRAVIMSQHVKRNTPKRIKTPNTKRNPPTGFHTHTEVHNRPLLTLLGWHSEWRITINSSYNSVFREPCLVSRFLIQSVWTTKILLAWTATISLCPHSCVSCSVEHFQQVSGQNALLRSRGTSRVVPVVIPDGCTEGFLFHRSLQRCQWSLRTTRATFSASSFAVVRACILHRSNEMFDVVPPLGVFLLVVRDILILGCLRGSDVAEMLAP